MTDISDQNSVAASAAADEPQELTLAEYCVRKSQTDRRVELINGFHHDEKVNGRIKDTEHAFDSRFAAFINKPA